MGWKGGENELLIREDAQPPVSKRLERYHIGLEKHFEDWIANDVPPVGRQARAAVIVRECRLAGAGGTGP